MTTSKSIMSGAALGFALLFGGGVFLFANFGSVAKQVAERIGTQTLGVEVSIGSIDVSLAEKKATVNGLRIANPEGFSGPDALTVDTIHVSLGNVSRALVDFVDIEVAGTNIYLEVKENGNNLHALRSGIKTAPQEETAPAEEGKEPLKVIIHRFAMLDAALHPTVTLVEEQALTPLVVQDIVLTDIGVKDNGILAREAIGQIVASLTRSVNRAAAEAGFLQGMSPDALKDMGLSRFQLIKDNVDQQIDNVTDGIKSIFQ